MNPWSEALAPIPGWIWSVIKIGMSVPEPERGLSIAGHLRRVADHPGLPPEIACVARAGARRIIRRFHRDDTNPRAA